MCHIMFLSLIIGINSIAVQKLQFVSPLRGGGIAEKLQKWGILSENYYPFGAENPLFGKF